MSSNGQAVVQRGDRLWLWCPGCSDLHAVNATPDPNGWTWDGDLERPTISPSILVWPHKTLIDEALDLPALVDPSNVRETPRCHSFVRDGAWEFLSDCTHALAGQHVPMADVTPEWPWEGGE